MTRPFDRETQARHHDVIHDDQNPVNMYSTLFINGIRRQSNPNTQRLLPKWGKISVTLAQQVKNVL
jgi:hypothetical protein